MSKKLSITLPKDLHDAVLVIAKASGCKPNDVICTAVTHLIADEEGKTIGETAELAIRAGLTNAEVLAKVRARFPKGDTSLPSIVWYRSKLRKAGEEVMTNPEARRSRAVR